MPSTSKKQHNFMAAVANNASFAKKAGVPQSVGKDFTAADKGIKFKGGPRSRPDLQKVNEPKTLQGKTELFKQGGTMATKMGKPTMKAGMSMAKDGMKKPTPMAGMMGMKKGGMPMKMKDGKKVPAFMNKGGSASSRADGVAAKGKTKGKMMNKGGKAC
jgi:hypothetical protein